MYDNLKHLPKPRIRGRRTVAPRRTRNFIDLFKQGNFPFSMS